MGNCKHCYGSGELKKKKTGDTFPCPYCEGTGNFIPISEKTPGGYYKRKATLRSGLSTGRYAGFGMSEDCYDDGYIEPTPYRFSTHHNTFKPFIEDGQTSEVKVFNASNELIRVETHIYRSSETGKTGKWELLSVVPC